MRFAFAQQVLALVFASMLLDGGLLVEVCLFALLAFWVAAILISLRRGSNPTTLDIILIQAGDIPLCFIAWFLATAIWKARGL